MEEKFYITTAIDYPNGNPHMGHAYEKIVTDVYARWNRLKSINTWFLTGTDEHGQKLQTAADEAKKSPQEFVDIMSGIFREFCQMLNVSNDDFIRTTEERHENAAKEVFQKVFDKEDIYLGKYSGNYCMHCEAYYTDFQLLDGKCPECQRTTKVLEEDAYFFKMSKYQEQVKGFIEKNPDFIFPETRRNEILSRLNEPLKDLCVSRTSFKWGIPLPNDQEHVIYVWFDALLNYYTAVKDKENLWPADVHVIGKDILWFHTVIWPSILLAAEIDLPKRVYVHGFINDKNGEKMSKSKGNVIDPVQIVEKYGADALKYYFLRTVPSGQDGNFDESELVERYNTELANDLGNLSKRAVTLVKKYYEGKISASDDEFEDEIDTYIFPEVDELMQKLEHHRAIEKIWALIKKTNAYMNEKEPWKIQDENELKKVMYNVVESLRIITNYASVIVPDAALRIADQLGFNIDGGFAFSGSSFEVKNEDIIFPKKEFVQEHSVPLDLRVAEIKSVEDHPEADKLYVLKIDIGNEERQLVAGIKHYYTKEELKGKKIIVVTNLKYAKLRGVESQGMLLAAQEGKEVGLLTVDAEAGTEVEFQDTKHTTELVSFDVFKKLKITAKDSKIYLDDKPLFAKGKEVIAEKVKNGEVS